MNDRTPQHGIHQRYNSLPVFSHSLPDGDRCIECGARLTRHKTTVTERNLTTRVSSKVTFTGQRCRYCWHIYLEVPED